MGRRALSVKVQRQDCTNVAASCNEWFQKISIPMTMKIFTGNSRGWEGSNEKTFHGGGIDIFWNKLSY